MCKPTFSTKFGAIKLKADAWKADFHFNESVTAFI